MEHINRSAVNSHVVVKGPLRTVFGQLPCSFLLQQWKGKEHWYSIQLSCFVFLMHTSNFKNPTYTIFTNISL